MGLVLLLCIDVGNTNILFGIFEEEKLLRTFRYNTKDFSQENDWKKLKNITGVAVSSVVPSTAEKLCNRLQSEFHLDPLVVTAKNCGLSIQTYNSDEVGVDMLCTAVGALEHYKPPLLIADLGTATTVSAIGKNGEFLGCSISAGIKTSIEALAGKTAQLSKITLGETKTVIGKNSTESMRSGIIVGTADMISAMFNRMQSEIDSECVCLLTGGFSGEVSPFMSDKIYREPDLLLNGLRVIFKNNE